MAHVHIVLLVSAALVGIALASDMDDILAMSSRLEANEFLDDLIETQLPRVLSDRAERIRDFSCFIRKKLLGGVLPTHRDLQANFTQGSVTGLLGVRRKGDCKPTFADGRYAVISCKLDIDSLKASYASSVKGFNLRGDIAHPVITADFSGSSLIFEARQIQSGESRPLMNALAVDTIKGSVYYESLGLNAERNQLFREQIMRRILPQILDLINIRLYRGFHDALRQQGVTIPEVRVTDTTDQ